MSINNFGRGNHTIVYLPGTGLKKLEFPNGQLVTQYLREKTLELELDKSYRFDIVFKDSDKKIDKWEANGKDGLGDSSITIHYWFPDDEHFIGIKVNDHLSTIHDMNQMSKRFLVNNSVISVIEVNNEDV